MCRSVGVSVVGMEGGRDLARSGDTVDRSRTSREAQLAQSPHQRLELAWCGRNTAAGGKMHAPCPARDVSDLLFIKAFIRRAVRWRSVCPSARCALVPVTRCALAGRVGDQQAV